MRTILPPLSLVDPFWIQPPPPITVEFVGADAEAEVVVDRFCDLFAAGRITLDVREP